MISEEADMDMEDTTQDGDPATPTRDRTLSPKQSPHRRESTAPLSPSTNRRRAPSSIAYAPDPNLGKDPWVLR